jgi:hypothetical protein
MLDPSEFGLGARGKATEDPPRVVCEAFVSPVMDAERRVRHDDVCSELRESVGQKAVAEVDDGRLGRYSRIYRAVMGKPKPEQSDAYVRRFDFLAIATHRCLACEGTPGGDLQKRSRTARKVEDASTSPRQVEHQLSHRIRRRIRSRRRAGGK